MDYKEFAKGHGGSFELSVFVVNRASNETVQEDATLQFGIPTQYRKSREEGTAAFAALNDLLGCFSDPTFMNAFPQSVSPALCGVVKMGNTLTDFSAWYVMRLTFNEIVAIVEAERECGRDQVD